MLLLAIPAAAQLQVGDYLHMNLNGNVGFNYAGGFNQGLSDHSMGFSGAGQLTGNYYSPNFLNFNVDPFYNRNQNDTTYGSLTNTSGVSANVNLFNGTHFPGTVSYNTLYNATSAFNVPGSELGLAQNTNTQMFGIGWSALLPGLPTLTANYSIGNTSSSILGTEGNDHERDHMLSLLSTYKWDGFNMTGQFLHRNTNAEFADLLQPGEAPIDIQSSSNSYGATVQHALPMAGNFGVSWNRLDYGYHYEDSYSAKNSGNTNTINGNASFRPMTDLGIGFNATYNDSLLGVVPEPLVNSGAELNLASAGTFRSVLLGSNIYYQVNRYLGVNGEVAHEDQMFLGQTYAATQYGAGANFNFGHSLLKGLSFSVGVVDTMQQGQNLGIGFVGNVNYNRKFLGWDFGANFSYAQNVQTVMLLYTTSSYTYMASVRHKFGDRKFVMFGYSGAHSGLDNNSGTSSSADRIYSSFIWRGNSFNAYYNKSDGLAIFTPTGLVSVPTNLPPTLLAGNEFTSYNSKGWGISAGLAPTRRLTITTGYAKSNGSTIDPLLSVYTNTTLINATMQYRLRKIFVNGGYTRLQQNVGAVGSVPLDVTTYFIGFSRWFNFF